MHTTVALVQIRHSRQIRVAHGIASLADKCLNSVLGWPYGQQLSTTSTFKDTPEFTPEIHLDDFCLRILIRTLV